MLGRGISLVYMSSLHGIWARFFNCTVLKQFFLRRGLQAEQGGYQRRGLYPANTGYDDLYSSCLFLMSTGRAALIEGYICNMGVYTYPSVLAQNRAPSLLGIRTYCANTGYDDICCWYLFLYYMDLWVLVDFNNCNSILVCAFKRSLLLTLKIF